MPLGGRPGLCSLVAAELGDGSLDAVYRSPRLGALRRKPTWIKLTQASAIFGLEMYACRRAGYPARVYSGR
jgi:hypothetical protein